LELLLRMLPSAGASMVSACAPSCDLCAAKWNAMIAAIAIVIVDCCVGRIGRAIGRGGGRGAATWRRIGSGAKRSGASRGHERRCGARRADGHDRGQWSESANGATKSGGENACASGNGVTRRRQQQRKPTLRPRGQQGQLPQRASAAVSSQQEQRQRRGQPEEEAGAEQQQQRGQQRGPTTAWAVPAASLSPEQQQQWSTVPPSLFPF